ncbi:hypothetical protein [Bacillus wiedmannii]|uniref:hypothetical protein n=1 Tax=Bacillus wiedmannii TaxID=1890302 RepID=UPI0020D2810F|nr:hypothetical protein [Bacillus wiedmannii]
MKYKELAEKYEISINILLSLGEKGMIGIEKGCTQMSKDERTNRLAVTLQTGQSILGFITGYDEKKKVLIMEKIQKIRLKN